MSAVFVNAKKAFYEVKSLPYNQCITIMIWTGVIVLKESDFVKVKSFPVFQDYVDPKTIFNLSCTGSPCL